MVLACFDIYSVQFSGPFLFIYVLFYWNGRKSFFLTGSVINKSIYWREFWIFEDRIALWDSYFSGFKTNGHVVFGSFVHRQHGLQNLTNFFPSLPPFWFLPNACSLFRCHFVEKFCWYSHYDKFVVIFFTHQLSYHCRASLWAKQSYVSFISFPSGSIFLYLFVCMSVCWPQNWAWELAHTNLKHCGNVLLLLFSNIRPWDNASTEFVNFLSSCESYFGSQ